jgi:Ca2+-binding EF-hand superfamily protein
LDRLNTMNITKTCLPTACLAITLTVTSLHGQQGADSADSRFQRLDNNGDGFLSKDEWMKTKAARKDPKRAQKRFSRMDQNSDGQISQEEFLAPKTEKTAQDQGGANE